MGRQADRFRRSHPADGDQGLPRQLPRRRRWAEGAQQAGRDRSLRQGHRRAGPEAGAESARPGRRRRRSCLRTRQGARDAHPRRGLRRVHGGQPQPLKTDRRALPLRGGPLPGRLAHAHSRLHCPPGRRDAVQQHHRGPWMVAGQPGNLIAALGLSPALRRS